MVFPIIACVCASHGGSTQFPNHGVKLKQFDYLSIVAMAGDLESKLGYLFIACHGLGNNNFGTDCECEP